jgi:hypothetical protein
MNRKLMMFCDARVCPSGKTCSNLLWHTLASPSLTPFDTGERGWGVKAGEVRTPISDLLVLLSCWEAFVWCPEGPSPLRRALGDPSCRFSHSSDSSKSPASPKPYDPL